MISIAYCIHNLGIGGAERHLLTVFKEMDRTRFEPVVICLGNKSNAPLLDEYERLGVQVLHLGLDGNLLTPANMRRLLRMQRFLVTRKINIVHGYLLEGNLVGVFVGRLAGVPVLLASKRSFDHHSMPQLFLCRIANHIATRVTANSRAVSNFVQAAEGCPKRKLVVIKNGVNGSGNLDRLYSEKDQLRRQWAIPDGTRVVGTVARFFWKKGYEYFIRSAAILLRERHDLKFVAIGDGPLKPRMEALAQDLEIYKDILFLGWQARPGHLLPLFDIYACPSVIEGMSNALLEAVACGLPVVASAVGGNVETIVDNRTGFLVPPRDPAAMARAISALLDDPPLMRRMGKAGNDRILKLYRSRQMVRKMESLYDTLLRQASSRA